MIDLPTSYPIPDGIYCPPKLYLEVIKLKNKLLFLADVNEDLNVISDIYILDNVFFIWYKNRIVMTVLVEEVSKE